MPDRIELAKALVMKIASDMQELAIGAPNIVHFGGKNTEGFGCWIACTYDQYIEFVKRVNNVFLELDLKRFTARNDRLYLDEIWIGVPENWGSPK